MSVPAASDLLPRQHPGTVDFHREVYCLLGLPFDAVDVAQAVARVRADALAGRRCFISTPNLNFLVAARTDAAFRDSVLHSDLSLADGMPVVWAARLLKVPIRERVAGAGLYERLRDHAEPPALSVYFFGGPDGVAEQACRRVNETAQGLRCVGFDSPGFVPLEQMTSDATIARINATGAQFVSVSLGAKKGQAWIERVRHRLHAPVVCHLGAVVNFAAGAVKRAPPRVQAFGLEWLWRIKEEPELWRRYGADGLAFMRLIATRLLPGLWHARRWAPRPGAPADARLSIDRSAGGATLRLQGAWHHAALGPLREALKSAVHAGLPLHVHLAGVSYVDSAFLGLLLLARGAFGDRLALTGASPRLRTLFHCHGAEDLLDATGTLS
jgi:N-acetylglucosaminyldiphosphoundecaprenol N-acetyl-beta-D-mannosaminyltransferase